MRPEKVRAAVAELAEALGGAANLVAVEHCVTRLRLELADRGAVDEQALRAHPAVLGLREDISFQVIVGPAAVGPLAAALREVG
ncbi:PTS transporter subunit EIIB [Nocardiopsis sp. CNT-189]|uniref:PTS transporter subunit EIIB n=1 Tax=Nocardiopsis oceanisediminis TaxID=2816862 RepID=UPI003B3712E3